MSAIRVTLGFLIAPGAPALTLYLINLHLVRRSDAEFGGVILAILSYVAALVVGIPAFLLARRWHTIGMLGYSALGAVVGLVSYILLLCVMLSSYQLPSVDLVGFIGNSALSGVLAVVCATAASALFWVIAIRSTRAE